MSRFFKFSVFLFLFCIGHFEGVKGQFSLSNFSLHLGYHFHNSHAKRINSLIDSFNEARFPLEIDKNLGSINFQTGGVFGVNYQLLDHVSVYIKFKEKHQRISTHYFDLNMRRTYLFRSFSAHFGGNYVFKEVKRFRHRAGGGWVMGLLGGYTSWQPTAHDPMKKSEMTRMGKGIVFGLSIHYEAEIKLWKYFSVFIRPTMEYAFPTNITGMTAMMNPKWVEGQIRYVAEAGGKYNRSALNGLGIEGGLKISLNEFSFGNEK